MAAKLCGAGERRRSCADTSHAASGFRANRQRRVVRVEIVHGVALQASDLDRLLIVLVHDAGAFAKYVDRTHARAAQRQNVRIQNRLGRSAQVAAGDLLDEPRDIDVGGAGAGAWRVEAVEAAVGLDDGGARFEGGMDLGEAAREFFG